MDIYNVILSVATGGVAGAAVNSFIALRKQKIDVTLSAIKDFFAFYENIGISLYDMRTNTVLDDKQMFNLRRVGNFLHYLVKLIESKYIDRDFFENVGILNTISAFSSTLTTAMQQHPEFESAFLWWPRLQGFNPNRSYP